MHDRHDALSNRIGNEAVDPRVRIDFVVVVDVLHLPEAQLSGGQCPLVMERRVGERGTELAGEDAGRDTDFAHADPHGRNRAVADQLQHPHIIVRFISRRGDLDDVGIEAGQPGMNFRQVLRCLTKVVQADDSLRPPVNGNSVRDIRLQIDVLDTFRNRGSQQHQSRFFTPLPFPLVLDAPTGGDHRARAVAKQPLQIDLPPDVIQADLDHLSSLLDQVSMFRHHMPVTTTSDTHANHGAIHISGRGFIPGAFMFRSGIPRCQRDSPVVTAVRGTAPRHRDHKADLYSTINRAPVQQSARPGRIGHEPGRHEPGRHERPAARGGRSRCRPRRFAVPAQAARGPQPQSAWRSPQIRLKRLSSSALVKTSAVGRPCGQ